MFRYFSLHLSAVLLRPTWGQAQDAPEFVAISGVPTMIYGQRNECTKDVAPSYEAVLEANAVTRAPEHGALSGGGVGERYSKSCDRRVPVREILYTSVPGYTGTDSVTFWGQDSVIINVVPAAMAQPSSSTVPPESSLPARSIEITRLSADETERLGWNPSGLDAVFDHASNLSTDTFMIVTKNKTVGSFGDLKRPYRTHSIRKAFLSALVGRYSDFGTKQIRLNATLQELAIDDFPKPLTSLQKETTVRHLLKSLSGINHAAAASGGLVADIHRRLGDTENKPGTIWAYNNWDYNALTTIFETRVGIGIAEAFEKSIAKPIGMQDYNTGAVSYSSEPSLSIHKAAQFRMSARDLAKFGQLYLDEGRAKGLQVLPASWIDLVTTDFTKTGKDGLSWGHGYLWWITDLTVGLPDGSFWAFGLGHQASFVIPAWDTVIVHQSDTTEFLKRFIPMIRQTGGKSEAAIGQLVHSCHEADKRED